MYENGIPSAGSHLFAHYCADIVPILMENGFANGINAAWSVGCAFCCGEHGVRLRLFAHKRGQVYQHCVVALGATNPEILVLRRAFHAIFDGLWRFTGKACPRFADDLFAGRAGAIGT